MNWADCAVVTLRKIVKYREYALCLSMKRVFAGIASLQTLHLSAQMSSSTPVSIEAKPATSLCEKQVVYSQASRNNGASAAKLLFLRQKYTNFIFDNVKVLLHYLRQPSHKRFLPAPMNI